MRAKFLCVAIASVAALAFAGCGGSDDSSGDELSKDDLIEQADTICSDASDKAADFEEPDADFDSIADLDDDAVDEVTGYLEEVRDLWNDQLSQLQDLTPPSDLSDDWDALMADLESIGGDYDDAISAVNDKDGEAFLEVTEKIGDTSSDASEKAKEIGLTECGGSGS